MGNQEKTEMKEKKWMRPETKTALGALIMGVASILCALTISSSDSFTRSGEPMAVAACAAAAACVVVAACVACAAVAACVAGVAGTAGVAVTWDKKEKEVLWMPAILLFLLFALPLLITITPLSQYYNYRQLERDQKIVEMLELTVLEDRLMVLLPDKCVGENSYLKKVFSLGWAEEINKKRWKEIAIPCRKGDSYWYEAKLPFSEKKPEAARLELRFDHAWEDLIVTKEVSLK